MTLHFPSVLRQEFREFPLREIEEKTHNVRRFRVGLPSEEHVMGMKTASCIVIRGKGQNGDMVVRPYTPATTNDTKVPRPCLHPLQKTPYVEDVEILLK